MASYNHLSITGFSTQENTLYDLIYGMIREWNGASKESVFIHQKKIMIAMSFLRF